MKYSYLETRSHCVNTSFIILDPLVEQSAQMSYMIQRKKSLTTLATDGGVRPPEGPRVCGQRSC
jgi:hypothetical protein